MQREKGNLNINEILKDKKEKENDKEIQMENTPIKERSDKSDKDSKEFSSSSAETSPSPAKREEQTFNC